MKDVLDVHVHTTASGHAYNTLSEVVAAANGVLALAAGNAEAAALKAEAEKQIDEARKAREAEQRRKEQEEAARRREAERQAEESRKAAEAKRAAEEAAKGPKAGETKTITLPGGAKMELVWCPAGSFTMESPAGEGFFKKRQESGRWKDEQQHLVALTKGFWMGKHEVTQKQWASVMGSNPSWFKGGDLPVENVSWEDCQEFLQTLNSRYPQEGMRWALPTEAQWEYACRAGSTGPYAGTGQLDDMGWFSLNSGGKTHPVGEKLRTHGDCTICTETCGSGVRTGTATIRRET